MNGKVVSIGNEPFLKAIGLLREIEAIQNRCHELRDAGQTILFMAVDKQLVGLFGVADTIKSHAADAIHDLQNAGLRIIMLTGDHRITAEAIARQLGIKEVLAEVLPAQKSAAVAKLQAEGFCVAMAGDGINDAPALAKANIGIAMGTGADVAMESAAITLVKGDLRAILRARRLSVATIIPCGKICGWRFSTTL